jgi:glutaredoxin 3
MSPVRIYVKHGCNASRRALTLLAFRGVSYDAIYIDERPREREAMIAATGGATSTPQIFIRGRHLGGADELARLDAKGGLRDLAEPEAPHPPP